MKNKIKKIWDWMKKHPKQVYVYSLFLLLMSLGVFIAEIFFFPKQKSTNNLIPLMFSSDNYIKSSTKESHGKMKKIDEIFEELEMLKRKETLSKEDSIRVEYLLNKYKKLSDEYEKN